MTTPILHPRTVAELLAAGTSQVHPQFVMVGDIVTIFGVVATTVTEAPLRHVCANNGGIEAMHITGIDHTGHAVTDCIPVDRWVTLRGNVR